MELQLRVEEICSEGLLCAIAESLRRVIFPRTPIRCCSGSKRTLKSYLVKVNASRSIAWSHSEPNTTSAAQANFIFIPTSSAAVLRFQIAQLQPLPKHSATALAQASGSKPGNRICG